MSKFRKKLQQHKPVIWTPRQEVLIDPPIPVPLSGTAPRVVMGQAWWDKVRLAAKIATNFHCIACKIKPNRLEGHERYEIDWLLGRATYLETVPLCKSCHLFIHQGFMKSQVDSGKMTEEQRVGVINRGLQILREAGIKRPDDSIHRSSVEWQDWRLVVEGREFPPLYDSLEDFRKAMRNQG